MTKAEHTEQPYVLRPENGSGDAKGISVKEFRSLTPEAREEYLEAHPEVRENLAKLGKASSEVITKTAVPAVAKQLAQTVNNSGMVSALAQSVDKAGEGIFSAFNKAGVGIFSAVNTVDVTSVFDKLAQPLVKWANERRVFCELLAEAFKEDAARENLNKWYQTSELTKNRFGRPTYTMLAELLGVTVPTARDYLNGKHPMSEDAVSCLVWNIGRKAAYELAFGEGTYDDYAEQKRLEKLRVDIKAAVEDVPENRLDMLMGIIQDAIQSSQLRS